MDEQVNNDRNRPAWTGKGEFLERERQSVAEQAISRMHIAPDAHVLDVGCGSGSATRRLADYALGGRVTGIDISAEMVRVARESSTKYANVEFEIASAEALPFRDGAFTHAFCLDSLYYYRDIQGAIGEVYRVLRDGGMFVAVVDLYQENEPTNYWVEKLAVQVHQLAIADYHTLYRRSGFVHVRDERIIDMGPPNEEFPAQWFETAETYREYRENGSLMITAIVEK